MHACMSAHAFSSRDIPVAYKLVCLLVGCLTSQQHASVSQRRICSDNCTCCHTEIEFADQTFFLTQLQYTDTGPPAQADPSLRHVSVRVVMCMHVRLHVIFIMDTRRCTYRNMSLGLLVYRSMSICDPPPRNES